MSDNHPAFVSNESAELSSRVEDLGRDRAYRSGDVHGKKLPTYLVRSLGLVNHLGNVREEWAALAIAGHLSDVTEANDADGIRYRNRHTGTQHRVDREEGTIHKSRQSFVEDIRRRIWKKAKGPEDRENREQWSEGFERDYDRLRHAIDRLGEQEYLVNEGPAVEAEDKPVRDRNGRRWSVQGAFRRQPDADTQRRFVRCTGPEPEVDWDGLHIDVLDCLERIVAHQEDLHEGFTAGWKAEEKGGEWTTHQAKSDAARSHQWTARNGVSRPQYVSVGRWRSEEIEEADLKGERAVTVPWIVFDIDADTKEQCASLAYRLVQLLSEHLTEEQLSRVLCSYTGGTSIHVRVPAGLLGNPVFKSADAAARSLSEFADRLCEGHPELREAIDDRLFHPRQMVRMIGSTYDEDTDAPDNSSWRAWLIQRLSVQAQIDDRDHAAQVADQVLEFLRQHHLAIEDVDLHFSSDRPLAITDAEDQTPNTNRVVACTGTEYLDHGAGPLWARSQDGTYQSFDIPDPTSVQYSQELSGLLRTAAPSTQKSDTYSVAKQHNHAPTGEYARALEVEREGEKWGRDVDKPHLVGRNRAALTVSLHRLTYSETPWRDVCAWNRDMAEPLPEIELRKTFRSANSYINAD